VVIDAVAELEQGRECYAQQRWVLAYELLSAADRTSALGPEDLEALARSAYMRGFDAEYVEALERAHSAYLDSGQPRPAAGCGIWAGLNLLARGERSRANGWFGRARRLLDRDGGDCIERGYLLIPDLLEQEDRGDAEAAFTTASEAAAIGERFGDADLVALMLHSQGQALVRLGRREEGMQLVDEALVTVTSGGVSPIPTGIIYCSTIDFCQSVYELRRAREWTEALTRWWEQRPEMVAYTGVCLVHRAEIMEMAGAWQEALEEARRAHERFVRGTASSSAIGRGHYREGELHRLRGEFAEAESAYREAAGCGCEPQPGLALLRQAQGRSGDAAGGIRRALGEATGESERLTLLPACVEIMIALGEPEEARAACDELERSAERLESGLLEAISLRARGSIQLAAGDPSSALVALRRSFHLWEELGVPYEAARTRELIGRACRVLGDEDAAALEHDAARTAFAELGAVTDLERLDLLGSEEAPATHDLTDREVEVLRLVASGDSNREIASTLVISEHTVARHLQNIFAKLNVSSRTAAGAFAFEHDLV
jgi:ATP/maltotriose-dependent transcriptional regulator MalT